jgi:hypothetical protein
MRGSLSPPALAAWPGQGAVSLAPGQWHSAARSGSQKFVARVPVAYLVVSGHLHHPPNSKQVAGVSFGHSLGTAASVPAALLAHACDMLRSDGKLYLFCRMSLHVFLTLLVSNGGLPTSIVYLQVTCDPSCCLYLAFTHACATVQRQRSQHVRH